MQFRMTIVVVLLALVASCSGGGPAGVVESFYRSVEAGELDAAIGLLSTSSKAQLPEAKLKQGLQQVTRQISEKGGIDRIEVIEEEVIGQTAEVKVRIVFGNGTEDIDDSSLIKEEGDWRLQPSGAK